MFPVPGLNAAIVTVSFWNGRDGPLPPQQEITCCGWKTPELVVTSVTLVDEGCSSPSPSAPVAALVPSGPGVVTERL
jgi:hypothetical protein